MILNCLVIDDEPLARMHIENYITRVHFLKLSGGARNISIAKKILESEAIDLIFLDIKMPETTGIEFLRQANIFQQVIVITAYPEYALDGFDLEVADYLMKPVTFDRFEKAVDKAYARLTGFETVRKMRHEGDFCYVKTNQRYEKLVFDDIQFIKSMLNYIQIFTTNGKFTVYSSLKNIATVLPKYGFIQIHKSYIISITKINTLELQYVVIDDQKLPISRGHRNSIVEAANKIGLILE
jgi:DNA-binding LytR/AlgR family response regulator